MPKPSVQRMCPPVDRRGAVGEPRATLNRWDEKGVSRVVQSPKEFAKQTQSFRAVAARRRAFVLTFRALVIVLLTSAFLFVLLRDASRQSLDSASFQVIPDKSGALTLEAAISRLSGTPRVLRKSTERATTPFWLYIPLEAASGDDVIVFGDKQISTLELWLVDGSTYTSLGRFDVNSSGDIEGSNVFPIVCPTFGEFDLVITIEPAGETIDVSLDTPFMEILRVTIE